MLTKHLDHELAASFRIGEIEEAREGGGIVVSMIYKGWVGWMHVVQVAEGGNGMTSQAVALVLGS